MLGLGNGRRIWWLSPLLLCFCTSYWKMNTPLLSEEMSCTTTSQEYSTAYIKRHVWMMIAGAQILTGGSGYWIVPITTNAIMIVLISELSRLATTAILNRTDWTFFFPDRFRYCICRIIGTTIVINTRMNVALLWYISQTRAVVMILAIQSTRYSVLTGSTNSVHSSLDV